MANLVLFYVIFLRKPNRLTVTPYKPLAEQCNGLLLEYWKHGNQILIYYILGRLSRA